MDEARWVRGRLVFEGRSPAQAEEFARKRLAIHGGTVTPEIRDGIYTLIHEHPDGQMAFIIPDFNAPEEPAR